MRSRNEHARRKRIETAVIRIYLLLLLVFVGGAVAMSLLAQDAGYVLIEIGHWVIESSVPGALLVIVLVFAVLWLIKQAVQLSMGLPARLRAAQARRTAEQATQSFEAGVLRLFEGDWSHAELELVRRAADHVTPHLNYIAAAFAAHRLAAVERRDHYLQLALRNDPAVQAAVLHTQAEFHLSAGEFVAARDLLTQLRGLQPRHAGAVTLLARALAGLADWDALIALIKESESYSGLNPEQQRDWVLRAVSGQLDAALRQTRLDRLKSVWEGAGAVRENPSLRSIYVRALIRLNAQAEAAAQISVALSREWDAALVECYGDLESIDPITQLASVEQWLSRHGERSELLLVAGRVCLRARLWGKARSYLEAGLSAMPSVKYWLVHAQLCEQTQSWDEAHQSYKKGLEWAARLETATETKS